MCDILLSVIIPTKNRYKSLIPTIRAICKYVLDPRIEFVVQDNSSNNYDFIECLNEINDLRIRYFYTSEDIDAVTNFNKAISSAHGKYLIMIGDDDLINPYIMNILDIVTKIEIDCLIYPRANYFWSDVLFSKELDFFEPSSLQVVKDTNLNFQKLSSQDELKFVLSMGGIYLYKLPALYHGIVKKEILDIIYKKHGTYVLGASPDMSLAISIAFELEFYHYINFPVSIAGASYNSAAGMGRRGEHSASLENLPDIVSKNIALNWDPKIPRLWNGFTVYAQSIFLVYRSNSLALNINYIKLYEKILKNNFRDIIFLEKTPYFKNIIFVSKYYIILKNLMFGMAKNIIMSLPHFLINYFIRNLKYFSWQKHVKNIKNVEDCMLWLKNEYKNQHF